MGQANIQAALLSAGIALGSITALAYLSIKQETEGTALAVAATIGTLTNTVLVLGMIGLLGSLGWVPVIPWGGLLGLGLANGIPEIIAAVLITVAVVASWKQIEFGRKGARIFRE